MNSHGGSLWIGVHSASSFLQEGKGSLGKVPFDMSGVAVLNKDFVD